MAIIVISTLVYYISTLSYPKGWLLALPANIWLVCVRARARVCVCVCVCILGWRVRN
jgi:hypothetical protein